MQPQGIGEPSVYHAVVVIFLEFFAWGLLTTPMLTVSVVLPALMKTQCNLTALFFLCLHHPLLKLHLNSSLSS